MSDQLSGQGKEIGSVLIAVNSYTQPGTNLPPLPQADQVLSDYIKTFHEILFFKVTWLFDYTLDAFWSECHEFFKNAVGDHVAVVLYGHGGIDDKIERLRTKSDPLQIHILEHTFAQKCPKKNRYLFLDLCRERDTVAPAVYQADTEGTFIVRSTLSFHEAQHNLWSPKMAKHLCNHANLSDVIRSVDDEIMRETPSFRQASDEQAKGTSGTPNFRELANFANMEFKTRALTQNLDDAIQNAKKDMDAYRALASGSEQTKNLKVCDNPHIQSLKRHILKRYVILKPSESRARVEYVQITLLKSQPYRHRDEEEILTLGSKKLDFLESFRSCGLKSGKVWRFIDDADLLQPTSDPDNRIKVVYGQAGIGKTTLLTHICRSLAMDRIKSSYHLVLYFPLGDKVVSSAKTLSDLLSYYAASAESLSAVKQAIVDSDDKEVLFIFDGANEVQDLFSSEERGVFQELLEGRTLPQADVIVSSRPGGLSHLMKQTVPVVYEIYGLPKLSIEQYIKEFFKSYPEKGERLWKELQSRDDLMGGAHIPMTLLIFCHIFGKGGLPPTLTDCHKQFIVEVHNRESPEKKWIHFHQCPEDVKQLLHSLGRLAYNGLMFTPSTFAFAEEEVEEAFKTTSLDKSTFKGLLHERPSISEVYGNNSTFNFFNTTQQELFSAYYISCLPVENQIEFLRNYMSQPKFSMVVRFYAGLTGLVDEQVVHTVLCAEAEFFNRHPFLQMASTTGQNICALDNLVCSNDDPGLLRLFHFLYESQNSILTQAVAGHLDGKSIIFSLFLTSYDSRVIAHCLRESHSFSHLCFAQETIDSDHVLLCLFSILMSDSVIRIQKLTLLLDQLTLTSAFHLKEGLARTAVEKMVLSVDYIDMLVVAAIFEAPGLKSVSLSVHECRGARDDGDSDLQMAQLFARNTSIKKLVVRSPPSFLLPVVKGLGANTCVVKLHLHSTDGDGSVGQALATASTANTTLKDITLLNVSPFPLMEILSSREVALDKLQIQGSNPYRLESLDTLAQNIKVKRFEAHMNFWTAGKCKAFADGLSRNKFLQEVELTVPKDVMDYVSAKMSNLRATTIKVLRNMGPWITSKWDFAQFLDHFLPNLLLLSDVLGLKNQAAGILNDKSNATEKCLNILNIWLNITDSPTWKLFCSILQRHYTFSYVRSLIEDSLYAEGEDRFQEDYRRAVEAHGCIKLTITKCTTIGPPRIGKTCLKHLLTNTPWDVSQDMPSTKAIRAPEWVECFRGEANSLDWQWTTFSRKQRIQALFCSIEGNNYEPSEPNSNDSVAEHYSPSENTRGQVLTTEPAESTISTVPAVPESIPDPSALVPEEQTNTSYLNHPAFLASEAATPKSSKEYNLLRNELISVIPAKQQEDEENKGRTLNEMQILHFIDTGGQSEYHDVHPVLITSPSVYLVVFNLMECFSGMKSKDDFLSSDLTQKALRSIHTLSSKEPPWNDRHFKYRPEQPKIFLTGTHLDVLTTNISDASSLDKVLAEIHEYIQKKMVGMPYRNYLMYDTNGRCFWAVSNLQAGKKTDKYLKDLRQLIVEESMTMHVKLPITWFILEHIAASCKPLFEYNNIFQMARDSQLVANKKEFDALLHVFHILGLFFVPDDDALESTKAYVFTDPNLLYSLTSHLLSNLKESENLRHTRDAIQEAIRNVIDKMVEDKQLKEAISIDPDWFISLLCQLRLMAQLGEDGTSDCIIPAILPKKSVQFENPSVISLLLTYYIQHSEFSFVPSGLFCALIADIIRSKPSMASSVWEPQQLYRCQVVFKVDFGEVCIQENHSNIQFDVRFESRIQKEGLSAEKQYCDRLREDLCKRLVAISGSLYQQSKSDFDAVAMWGIPCQYHKNERDPSHLAVCYKIPQTDLYCATCMGDPQTEVPFQILRSDRDIVWFANL